MLRHASGTAQIETFDGTDPLAQYGKSQSRIGLAGIDEHSTRAPRKTSECRQPCRALGAIAHPTETNGIDWQRAFRQLVIDLFRRHAAGGIVQPVAEDHQRPPRG